MPGLHWALCVVEFSGINILRSGSDPIRLLLVTQAGLAYRCLADNFQWEKNNFVHIWFKNFLEPQGTMTGGGGALASQQFSPNQELLCRPLPGIYEIKLVQPKGDGAVFTCISVYIKQKWFFMKATKGTTAVLGKKMPENRHLFGGYAKGWSVQLNSPALIAFDKQ